MRNKYNKEQMFALIEEWEMSNKSQDHFAKSYKISKSTFCYWRKKYRNEFGEETGKMIPINFEKPKLQTLDSSDSKIEIVYPNGVRIVCSSSMGSEQIKNLIF
jgi:hypothetical protein